MQQKVVILIKEHTTPKINQEKMEKNRYKN